MREIETLVDELTIICKKNFQQAQNYLLRAREMKKRFGYGFATIYCWFYSVPQKWITIEPKIFELISLTNSFDLNVVIEVPVERLALALRHLIFFKELSIQLKNFCRAIKEEYESWDTFVRELIEKDLFEIFRRLRKYRNTRITFKNLMAMKIFLGMEDNLMILDSHVASFLGIDQRSLAKCKYQEPCLRKLLKTSQEITSRLKKLGFHSITTAIWSLSVWFEKSKVKSNELLVYLP